MAKSIPPSSWTNGFREPAKCDAWAQELPLDGETQEPHYVTPPSAEVLTSSVHNHLGLNVLRTWPTLYDGTRTPHNIPGWWQPSDEVDVLICGAGPSGLQVALSLVRQGVTFRIIDKAAAPLVAGRADGVQPRFLETLHSWGLATEVHEEGPLIERTAIYKDGKKLLFNRSHQSDSRYRGLHIITQGQIERIYIRDLARHRQLVERETVVTDFEVRAEADESHPIRATVKDESTGAHKTIRAKYLVGSDGASSMIRKKLGIPYEGVSTNIYWGIMDCIFESDYPHAWVFGSVISSQHGGCVIIPREDGYIRLYTQLDISRAGEIAKSRQANTADAAESGGQLDISTITAEEVLEQANRIFAPYKLKFAAPLSWFAIWKISERVARSFSSNDCRVHLVGDAAHVHSVMGAFGLNASIMDSANLAWKLGLCARNRAQLSVLGPTYDAERRLHARRIIRVSGSYLRFVCNSDFPLAQFNSEEPKNLPNQPRDAIEYTAGHDLEFLHDFFSTNGQFLLGVDAAYPASCISPARIRTGSARHPPPPIAPRNGVRAPNPRLCLSTSSTGYLYDVLTGAATIHIVLFGSDLQGPIRARLAEFSSLLEAGLPPTKCGPSSSSPSFYLTYGAESLFNIVLVTKCLPHEAEPLLTCSAELAALRARARVVYDDRAPDEDAHTCYEINHAEGAVVVVRPDLWVGTSFYLKDAAAGLDEYFASWLVPLPHGGGGKVDEMEIQLPN